MVRYLILICAVTMQICLGATYSWSIYVNPLKQLTGLGQGAVQIPFTLFYFTFPATMMVVGGMLHRLGVRKCSLIGGVIFGCGWILAGFGDHHFLLTVLGIGLLAGVGVGFAYMVPIATAILWFPDHKGLVTGIAVAGFGGGAALISQVGSYLMETRLLTPFEVFTALGFAFAMIVSVAGLIMKTPPGFSDQQSASLKLKKVITDKTFLLLYFSMFSALAAGFTINANLKELNASVSLEIGVLAVSLFAIANALGRLSWGWLFDRMNSRLAIRLNLWCQGLLLILGLWILKSSHGFLIFALFAGFNYGGVLVIYASTLARQWGSGNVGQLYGWLFSANIPAALAPLLAGVVFEKTGSFTLPLSVLAALLICVALGVGKQLSKN